MKLLIAHWIAGYTLYLFGEEVFDEEVKSHQQPDQFRVWLARSVEMSWCLLILCDAVVAWTSLQM